MILYHGTPVLYETFKTGEEFAQGKFLAEGLGIYMTEEAAVAANFGRYLLEVEVDPKRILDLTNKKVISTIIKQLDAKVEGLITTYLSPTQRRNSIDSISRGLISASKFGDDYDLLIDSNEAYHMSGDVEKELSVQTAYEELLQERVIRYFETNMGKIVYLAKNPALLSISSRTILSDEE